MSDNIDTKVPIKDELKKDLIFGLGARPSIGIILGFVGYREKVMPLMQTISHGSRAYFVNADGLPGFINLLDIAKCLEDADVASQLEHAKTFQMINIDNVNEKLNNLESQMQKMKFLSEEYPSLFVFVLEYLNLTDRIMQYMAKC